MGTVSDGVGASAAEQPLVDLVQDLWGSMARRSDPDHGWPRYTPAGDAHFAIDAQSATGTQLDAATCDFWDSLSRYQASARALELRCSRASVRPSCPPDPRAPDSWCENERPRTVSGARRFA
ncbi:MAG TPA: hypothetical protein VH165_19175 [Kofleriaceae bacterium]|nr:hypothetical protein [Kofleriaceae bacterium]